MHIHHQQVSERGYNRAIYTALRIGFMALLLVWSALIVKPFILPVIWGIIIAIAIFPLFEKLAGLTNDDHGRRPSIQRRRK